VRITPFCYFLYFIFKTHSLIPTLSVPTVFTSNMNIESSITSSSSSSSSSSVSSSHHRRTSARLATKRKHTAATADAATTAITSFPKLKSKLYSSSSTRVKSVLPSALVTKLNSDMFIHITSFLDDIGVRNTAPTCRYANVLINTYRVPQNKYWNVTIANLHRGFMWTDLFRTREQIVGYKTPDVIYSQKIERLILCMSGQEYQRSVEMQTFISNSSRNLRALKLTNSLSPISLCYLPKLEWLYVSGSYALIRAQHEAVFMPALTRLSVCNVVTNCFVVWLKKHVQNHNTKRLNRLDLDDVSARVDNVCATWCAPLILSLSDAHYQYNNSFEAMANLLSYGSCEVLITDIAPGVKCMDLEAHQTQSVYINTLKNSLQCLNRYIVAKRIDIVDVDAVCYFELVLGFKLPNLQMVCIYVDETDSSLVSALQHVKDTLTHLYIESEDDELIRLSDFVGLQQLTHFVFKNCNTLYDYTREETEQQTQEYIAALIQMPRLQCVSIPDDIIRLMMIQAVCGQLTPVFEDISPTLTTFYNGHIYAAQDGDDRKVLGRAFVRTPTVEEFSVLPTTKQSKCMKDMHADVVDKLGYGSKVTRFTRRLFAQRPFGLSM